VETTAEWWVKCGMRNSTFYPQPQCAERVNLSMKHYSSYLVRCARLPLITSLICVKAMQMAGDTAETVFVEHLTDLPAHCWSTSVV